MQKICLFIIRIYKIFLSPLLGPCCRFVPSCSEYAFLAIERFGAWRGLVLAAGRILRCHPFHPGGLDPVPSSFRQGLAGMPGQKVVRRLTRTFRRSSPNKTASDRPPDNTPDEIAG